MGSLGAMTAAAGFVILGEKAQKMIVAYLISFATGTLLTAALVGLIPEAIELAGYELYSVMAFVLGSILFFFFLEKIVIWRICSKPPHDGHGAEIAAPLVLIGDAFHNFIDGVVIAAAFSTNFTIGITVSLSIIVHEIPQETGDFGILLKGGYSKKKAYVYNALSSATTIPAAIVSYYILEDISIIVPYILSISAASFLYIALSDLTPELHQKLGFKNGFKQFILIMLGVFTMALIFMLGGHSH